MPLTAIPADDLARHDLVAALRRQAEGNLATVAAVELVIESEDLLTELVAGTFVDVLVGEGDGAQPYASIKWSPLVLDLDTGYFEVSSGAEGVLRIAASLAAGNLVNLKTATRPLDRANSTAVVAAVATACNLGVRVTGAYERR